MESCAVKTRKRKSNPEVEVCSHGLMRVGDAARFLGVSRTTVYDLLSSAQLPYCEISVGTRAGDRRIPKLALILFAESRLRVGTTATEETAA